MIHQPIIITKKKITAKNNSLHVVWIIEHCVFFTDPPLTTNCATFSDIAPKAYFTTSNLYYFSIEYRMRHKIMHILEWQTVRSCLYCRDKDTIEWHYNNNVEFYLNNWRNCHNREGNKTPWKSLKYYLFYYPWAKRC